MESTIIQAINEQKCLQINYDGENRLIEPHTYGSNAKGNLVLSAFQIEGFSESGERFGWKLFNLDKINSAHLIEQKFDIREGYNPNPSPKMFNYVIAKVA